MSKNKPTTQQLELACKHVDEMQKAGMTLNHAIRLLELLTDMYAKTGQEGKAKVWHVGDVPQNQWSIAARKLRKLKPRVKAGSILRVEHGTPRRQFAKKILELYRKKRKITPRDIKSIIKKYWKMAVITHEEDRRITRQEFRTPQARWAFYRIRFSKNSPNALR